MSYLLSKTLRNAKRVCYKYYGTIINGEKVHGIYNPNSQEFLLV